MALNGGMPFWVPEVKTHDGPMSVLASQGETLRIGAVTGAWSLECQVKATFTKLVYTPALSTDIKTIPAATGGTQNLTLQSSAEHAGQIYLLLGSLTGISPPLPVGDALLPLVVDSYLLYTLGNPNTPGLQNTLGVLDPMGAGAASLVLPPLGPAHVGLLFRHAYVLFDTLGWPKFASNPRTLRIV